MKYNIDAELERIKIEWSKTEDSTKRPGDLDFSGCFEYKIFVYSHDLTIVKEVVKDSWQDVFNVLYERNDIYVDRYHCECFDYDEDRGEEIDKTDGWTDEQWFDAILEYFNDGEYPHYRYAEIKV